MANNPQPADSTHRNDGDALSPFTSMAELHTWLEGELKRLERRFHAFVTRDSRRRDFQTQQKDSDR